MRPIHLFRLAFTLVCVLCFSVSAGAQSFEEVLAKANQNDASAQHALGLMYVEGNGVEQNDAEALKWFGKAAEQGLASAQYELGVMYGNGEGVTKNDAEAVNWFRKAAEQGDSDAQYNLGVIYQRGQGAAQDYAEAMRWHLKAAENGDVHSPYSIAVMYYYGEGVAQNYATTYKWLILALAQMPPDSPPYSLALQLRDELLGRLTAPEIAEAEHQAQEWQQQHRPQPHP